MQKCIQDSQLVSLPNKFHPLKGRRKEIFSIGSAISNAKLASVLNFVNERAYLHELWNADKADW